MRHSNKIEKLIKAVNIRTNTKTDNAVQDDILNTLAKSKNIQLADYQPKTWRITTKTRITKLAVAAVVIISAIVITFHMTDHSVINTSSENGLSNMEKGWTSVEERVAQASVIARGRVLESTSVGTPYDGYRLKVEIMKVLHGETLSRVITVLDDTAHQPIKVGSQGIVWRIDSPWHVWTGAGFSNDIQGPGGVDDWEKRILEVIETVSAQNDVAATKQDEGQKSFLNVIETVADKNDVTAAIQDASSEPRLLHFPNDRSLGRLMVMDSDLVGKAGHLEWDYLAEATGSVQIPPGKQVWLQVISATAWQDLSPLSSLKPHDLYRLGIYGSYSGGPKPDDKCMEHMGALTGLKALELMFTEVTGKGLRAIHDLYSLERLMLPERIDDTDMVQLAKLKSLKALSCRGKGVTDAGLRHLVELPLLEELALGGDRLSDKGLVYIARLPRLKDLELDGDFTDTGLSYLRDAPSLRNLYLGKLANVTDAGLAHLSHIPTLEMINLTGNRNITDKGIAHLERLPALKELRVNRCRVSDEALGHLKQVTTLERLDLPSRGITDKGLADIGQLAKLKELHVGGDITDTGLRHLVKLTSLEELEIDGEGITDEGIRQIAKLQNLTELNLNVCPGLTEEGIRQIAKLTQLTELNLSLSGCTNLGYEALSELAKIKGLKKLRLSFADTNVTVSDLSRLNTLSNLGELDIYDIKRGEGALDISGLTELERLTIYVSEKRAFTDRDLESLANLKNLKNLQLNSHEFSDAGVASLAGLINMEILVIGGPNMTDEALSYLSNMKRLGSLIISDGDITDTGMKRLEKIESLGRLQITSNCDISPGALDRLQNRIASIRVSKDWEVQKRPNVGDKAPDFKFTTMSGRTMELADFNDKVVLLYFWATWCRPCLASTPSLKRFYEDMSRYRDFEMISISQDDAELRARDYIEKHKLTWPQVCVGLNSKIGAEYGVNNRAPFYFLIGPDGKILSTRGNLSLLASEIEKILGPRDTNVGKPQPDSRGNLTNRQKPPYRRKR
ncbi:MAG TPA: redoxin domain-containing protein [Sedimentisphaerales bacterium]|nr:redoxin domain-containing protein [Sedimentisphaerales bacterium]